MDGFGGGAAHFEPQKKWSERVRERGAFPARNVGESEKRVEEV